MQNKCNLPPTRQKFIPVPRKKDVRRGRQSDSLIFPAMSPVPQNPSLSVNGTDMGCAQGIQCCIAAGYELEMAPTATGLRVRVPATYSSTESCLEPPQGRPQGATGQQTESGVSRGLALVGRVERGGNILFSRRDDVIVSTKDLVITCTVHKTLVELEVNA